MHKNFTYGQRGGIPRDAEESRVIPFVLSTYAKDRHGTVFNQEKWEIENYRKNPIIAYQHNLTGGLCADPSPDFVIGKSIRVEVEGYGIDRSLVADAQFEDAAINPLAEKIFRKLIFGSLSRCSVGFFEVGVGHYGKGEEGKGGINETYYFAGQELVEWSVVNISSNPEAGKRDVGMRRMREEGYTALMYALKELGSRFTLSQIEHFSVRDVLDLLDGKDLELRERDPEKIRRLLAESEAQADRWERMYSALRSRVKLTSQIG